MAFKNNHKTPSKRRSFDRIKSRLFNPIIHPYTKFVSLIMHPETYIQHRPYYDLGAGKCPQIAELNRIWNMSKPLERDNARLYFLHMIIDTLKDKKLEGAVAEIGVHKGNSAGIIHRLLPEKRIYLFDTFEGFKESDLEKEMAITGLMWKKGKFGNDTSLEIVKEKLGDLNNVIFCPGLFPETAIHVPENEKFCLLHFDADLYAPAKAACEFFYPRLVNFGVMIFHDYNNKYAGVRGAVDDYFKDTFIIPIPDRFGTGILIKSVSS